MGARLDFMASYGHILEQCTDFRGLKCVSMFGLGLKWGREDHKVWSEIEKVFHGSGCTIKLWGVLPPMHCIFCQ